MLQFLWQCRVVKVDAGFAGANLQAETSLEQHEYGPGSPGLRRTGDGVERGSLAWTAAKPADQFRQPMEHDLRSEVQQSRGDPQSEIFVRFTQGSQCDQGVVVWPQRS